MAILRAVAAVLHALDGGASLVNRTAWRLPSHGQGGNMVYQSSGKGTFDEQVEQILSGSLVSAGGLGHLCSRVNRGRALHELAESR